MNDVDVIDNMVHAGVCAALQVPSEHNVPSLVSSAIIHEFVMLRFHLNGIQTTEERLRRVGVKVIDAVTEEMKKVLAAEVN
jgi:hypothetical protein